MSWNGRANTQRQHHTQIQGRRSNTAIRDYEISVARTMKIEDYGEVEKTLLDAIGCMRNKS